MTPMTTLSTTRHLTESPNAAVSRSIERWLSVTAYGLFTSTLFGARTSPERLRARFDRFARVEQSDIVRKHPGVAFNDYALGPLEVESVRTRENPARVVLHLHGGAFVFGSPATYRNRAMRFAYRLDAEVFVPDYRLAPEHPFPAALEDAVVAYQYVRALRPSAPILVSGDSAGGGLALSLMIRLRELGTAPPDGAILLSPWTDLAVTGATVDTNDGRDRWFSRAHLQAWARYYTGEADPRDPLLSPVFADLSALPPMLVVAGADELLLDDATRVAAQVTSAGGDARLVVGKGMQHDFPLTLPWLPESRAAWAAMVAFSQERAARRATVR
jgi:acetyl esterase/lipase